MKEIYIIDTSYIPTAASNSRLFAYADYFLGKGIYPTFFFLFPDNQFSKCEQNLDKFSFVYLWEGTAFKNKYLNTLRSILKLRKIMRPEIPVYVYGMLNCLPFIVKDNIRIFHEYTENPEVVGIVQNPLGKYLLNLYKKSLQKVEGLFVITENLRQYYINELGASPEKIKVVNMLVDENRFSHIDSRILSRTISYCGFISEFKDGVSDLISSFALVYSKHPDWSLRVIGRFESNETEMKLRALVKHLGIESAVDFTGPVSSLEIPRLLKSSMILALARPDNKQSRYGFATKIGEYLMTERPVVLTDVGAVNNFLEHGKDCILAKPNDIEDFANKLNWAIENYNEALKIGRNGRLTALSKFNANVESEKIYKEIYK